MDRQIVYLMSGPAHMPYLAVSLAHLRRHWDGEVIVYAYPESYDIARRIGMDARIGIEPRLWDPPYRGKNGQFINKIQMMQEQVRDSSLYLDADTMVAGDLSPIFEALDHDVPFVVTQFCNWLSNGGQPRNRVSRLIGRYPIDQEAVESSINEPHPSVNGGVFAAFRRTPILQTWYDWTYRVKDIFIADETVLHPLSIYYQDRGMCRIMEGGAWNCSPKHQPKTLDDSEVRIWHFHGDSNVRPQKSQKGFDLWWPEYQVCLETNLGGISDWKDGCGNSYLQSLESAQTEVERTSASSLPSE